MKPTKLVMTAFGCYADTTVVEFDKLQSGLYLITGDTGAGKTTIYDAITFSLYGGVSGDERKAGQMHSDFVDKGKDTVVDLTFVHNGEEYNIKRTIHFKKKQDGSGYSSVPDFGATLIYPDEVTKKKETLSGATKVNNKVAEIIGLNGDQFRQIVMLAQGEFKKFLKSNSEDKSIILGKLFDNSIYLRYQELIGKAMAELKAERSFSETEIDNILQHKFKKPADEEFADIIWVRGEEHLTDYLLQLTEKEENELKILQQKKEDCRKANDTLNTELGSAKQKNLDLEDLERNRVHLKELEGKAEEYKALKNRVEGVKNACLFVLPAVEHAEKERVSLEKLKKTIESLKTDREGAEKEFNRLTAVVEADEENKSVIEDYVRQIEALEGSKKDYDRAEELRTEIQNREKKLSEDTQKKEKIAADTEALNKRILEAGTEAEGLKDAEVNLEKIKTGYKDASDLFEELSGDRGLKAFVEEIRAGENVYEKEQGKLADSIKEAKLQRENYDRIYNSFIDGQAGLLAGELVKTIESKGRGACPVCHTEFVKGGGYAFTEAKEQVPTQAEVDNAKDVFEKADESRAAQDKKCTQLKESLDQKKKQATDTAERLFKQPVEWETLDNTGFIAEQIDAVNTKKNELNSQIEDISRKVKRYNTLTEQLENDKAGVSKLLAEASALETAVQTGNAELAGRRKEYEDCVKCLKFESKNEVERQILELNEKKNILNLKVIKNSQDKVNAQNHFESIKGQLSSHEANLPAYENNSKAAEDALAGILVKYNCDGAESAKARLAGISNPEGWVREQENAIKKYDEDCTVTASKVKDSEAKTAGYVKQDLSELNNRIKQATEALEQAESDVNIKDQDLNNHKAVYERITEEKAKLKDTDYAWKILEELAGIAAGENADGGKISFERYVMGATFREIIDKANIRLEILSGGRYQLIHEMAGHHSASAAGLNIEVLDRKTGEQRESASLSGGESFIVSLALALGLSDEVRSRAGGQALETMFIDEGFGTLDDDILDKTIQVLKSLSEDKNHLVGIISHVGCLEESVTKKIVVTSGEKGSKVRIEGVES